MSMDTRKYIIEPIDTTMSHSHMSNFFCNLNLGFAVYEPTEGRLDSYRNHS